MKLALANIYFAAFKHELKIIKSESFGFLCLNVLSTLVKLMNNTEIYTILQLCNSQLHNLLHEEEAEDKCRKGENTWQCGLSFLHR